MINDTIFSHPVTASVIAALLLLGVIAKLMKFSFERIAKWYLYIAVFSVVIVMNSIFFPFIGGKDWFFRFSTELALACMVLWWAFEAHKGDLKKRLSALFHKPLVIAVTIFAAIFELACLFAYDAQAAFWSNYERGEGGFQMLHYYLFFLLLVLLFSTEKEWKNLFRFSLIATGLMILYGIAGNYSVAGFIGPYAGATPPIGWWHLLIDGRFEGSLGNPAYVDAYLLFSMFYVGYLWMISAREKTLTALKSWGYGVALAIIFIFFLLGQTRGAFIGLDAAIFMLLGYLVFQERVLMRKISASAVVAFIAIAFLVEKMAMGNSSINSLVDAIIIGTNLGILTFIVCMAFSKDTSMRRIFRIIMNSIGILIVVGGSIAFYYASSIQNTPEVRLLRISTSDTTAQTRFWVWGEAWQGFLERPVLGWGPENFTPVYDKFFNPKFYTPGQNNQTWFDRAHSVYFDYLTETGILGLLSYLGMFFMFYWEFFKGPHKRAESRIQRALIFAVPIAYLGQGIAIFDVFPMYISIFGILAFAAYYFSVHKKEVKA